MVVDAGNIFAAKSALVRLINDSELRTTLVENGKKTSAEWKWEPAIDKLENYFINTLQNKNTISTPVHEDINNAILFFQEMLSKYAGDFVISHPIDSLFLRLRYNKGLRWFAEWLGFLHKKITRIPKN